MNSNFEKDKEYGISHYNSYRSESFYKHAVHTRGNPSSWISCVSGNNILYSICFSEWSKLSVLNCFRRTRYQKNTAQNRTCIYFLYMSIKYQTLYTAEIWILFKFEIAIAKHWKCTMLHLLHTIIYLQIFFFSFFFHLSLFAYLINCHIIPMRWLIDYSFQLTVGAPLW